MKWDDAEELFPCDFRIAGCFKGQMKCMKAGHLKSS